MANVVNFPQGTVFIHTNGVPASAIQPNGTVAINDKGALAQNLMIYQKQAGAWVAVG